jgi:hypothetical protein
MESISNKDLDKGFTHLLNKWLFKNKTNQLLTLLSILRRCLATTQSKHLTSTSTSTILTTT